MLQPVTPIRTNWFIKFCECLLATVALLNLLLFPLDLIPASFWGTYGHIETYLLPVILVIALLSGLIYSIVWHRRERAGTAESGLCHAWLQGIIRYWLAFSISTYGFAKILKTQFETPDYRLDMPLERVSGMGLTWYYYGYSYTLAVIIACFQIGGSILLLHRRTTLLGVMILLPVLVNIVLINVIFGVTSGAFFNSVVFTLTLLVLLLLDISKLKTAFWDLVERLPPVRLGQNWAKNSLRTLPILAAFVMMFYAANQVQLRGDTVLKGTWTVEKLTRNSRVIPANAWLTDTTAWKRIYLAGWQGCAFSPNPFRYNPEESLRGNYTFDSLTNSLRLMLYRSSQTNVPDTLRATLTNRTHSAMHLRGVWLGDTLEMQLARLR